MRGTLLLFALSFISCKEKPVEDWQTFTHVYTDYLKRVTADTAKVENRDAYLYQILAQHNMSRNTFDHYFMTLKRNPEKLQQALRSINEELRKATNTPTPRPNHSNRSDK